MPEIIRFSQMPQGYSDPHPRLMWLCFLLVKTLPWSFYAKRHWGIGPTLGHGSKNQRTQSWDSWLHWSGGPYLSHVNLFRWQCCIDCNPLPTQSYDPEIQRVWAFSPTKLHHLLAGEGFLAFTVDYCNCEGFFLFVVTRSKDSIYFCLRDGIHW